MGKIARRSFLIGSAAIAGGVIFGVYKYKSPLPNPLLSDLPLDAAALTPYVRIDANGITLITPRADKGQGAYAVQAILIAEELDVEQDQIRVDPGPPSATYWNTALSGIASDFMAPGDGLINTLAHGVTDAAMKFLGLQLTGGSTTVPDGFDKLRQAGAGARETLKAAAAQQSGIAIDRLTTDAGAVHLPDGTSLSYTSLAPLAATLTPVTDVPLRSPAQWRLIGKPVQRLDMVAKCTGTLPYGIDLKIDGMVHATMLRNPAQGGGINGYDATDALKMRGIKAVLPVTDGVAVVADNTWRAFQARDAMTVDWTNGPFIPGMAGHWQALSDSFTKQRLDSRKRDDGKRI